MRALHFLGALALGALDGAARVAIPGFYGATGDAPDLHEEIGVLESRCAELRRRAESAEASADLADTKIRRLLADRDDARRERDEARQLADALRAEAAKMRLERDAEAQRANGATARVQVLEGSAEPVAWLIGYGARTPWSTASASVAKSTSGVTVEPLYRHPPKQTSEGDAFAVTFAKQGRRKFVGYHTHPSLTAAQAEATRIAEDDVRVVRIVPADAPVVDLEAIRSALAASDGFGGGIVRQSLDRIRAAVGDTAAPREARD